MDSINRIKPGIAEATRAVLRRVPDHVFVRQMDDPDVSLLVGLAKEKGIRVTEAGAVSYTHLDVYKRQRRDRSTVKTLLVPSVLKLMEPSSLRGCP